MRGCVNGNVILFAVMASASAVAAPPESIRLPVTPVAPQPAPPAPSGVSKLGPGQLYVIDSDVECLVLASPIGIVKTTDGKGPVKVFGVFVDGTWSNEWREFKGKQITIVEAAVSGRVELLIVPVGATTTKDVIRVTLDVTAGQGPIPPPKPKPDDPKPPEPAKTFRVIMVHETATPLTAAQHGVIYGKVVEEYLTKNATGGKAGWKRRDPNTPSEAGIMGELWTAAKAELKPTDPPCVVVEKDGKVEIIPLAATPEEMVAVFDKYVKGAK
jgi:hypothetical protein